MRSSWSITTAPTRPRRGAREAGARVITARRGYGRACAAGVAAADSASEILVFLDGDGSDCPESMDQLVRPIVHDEADFVIGSRVRGERETGSMNFQQIFAGRAAGCLLRLLYHVSFTDMGPFRAIRRRALDRLGMREETYGWNLEMQMRARARRTPHSRDPGQPSLPHRWRIKSLGHVAWHLSRRGPDFGDVPARRVRAAASTDLGIRLRHCASFLYPGEDKPGE